MTDKDRCSRAAEMFYQHLKDRLKKNSNDIVEDLITYAYEWALNCGFEHPRCFVKYIEDIEHDRAIERIQSKKNLR
jgi:hypothetical protein